ncbi:uncharacterized protein LOC128276407 [Anopheles cruzii]|uniref:uncharacterized protein LOC128276407 n=1 Tax=Anopheles cruzii TaxID=68878 RepID=UPI0022EC2134|nr:uncharacterized protein LOC128276407 [Anopheles cruzii]
MLSSKDLSSTQKPNIGTSQQVPGNRRNAIDVIDLLSDDDEEGASSRHDASRRSDEPQMHASNKRFEMKPICVRKSHTNSSPLGHQFTYARRSIHAMAERLVVVRSQQQEHAHSTQSPSTSGIILNRTYSKKSSNNSSTGSKNMYEVFDLTSSDSVRDTRNCLPLLNNRNSESSSRGVIRSTSPRYAPPVIDITGSKRTEQRPSFVRRSFHKPSTSSSVVTTIDLEQELSADNEPTSPTVKTHDKNDASSRLSPAVIATDTLSVPLAEMRKQSVLAEHMDVSDGEEINLELLDGTEQPVVGCSARDTVSLVERSPKDPSIEGGVPDAQEQCRSPEAPDDGSSMENSYGDVSSSGCAKYSSTKHSLGHRQGECQRRQSMNEFDLKLAEINETMSPMTHKDRVEQWRVTEEDLLHSIPTKSQIEASSLGPKRSFFEMVHISSDEDSNDQEAEPGSRGSLLANKKRRSGSKSFPETSRSLDDGSDLDFRKDQINPEIDKRPTAQPTMIVERKNYHKLPIRFRPCDGCYLASSRDKLKICDRSSSCDCRRWQSFQVGQSIVPENRSKDKAYAQLLSRDRERDNFLNYLRISPFHRASQQQHTADGSRTNPPYPLTEPMATGAGISVPQTEANFAKASAGTVKNKVKHSVQRVIHRKTRPKPKKKSSTKSKPHSSIIASSGILGVRRLVLRSSLRSGKIIRYRSTFVGLRQNSRAKAPKPHPGKVEAEVPPSPVDMKVENTVQSKEEITTDSPASHTPFHPQDEGKRLQHSLPPTLPPSSSPVIRKSKRSHQPTVKSLRCSVDSAVSSSTSADIHESKRSKECQTTETLLPCVPVAPEPPRCMNDGKPTRNPLNRSEGEVLNAFLLDEQLIVVQTGLVSFWKYSRLSVLLGVKQEWQRIAQQQRWVCDAELDTQNANRIGYNDGNPHYLEPRARNLKHDESRACPLASVYVNAYFLDVHLKYPDQRNDAAADADQGQTAIDGSDLDESGVYEQIIRLKSYQLDTIKSALEDVLFVPLPNSRYFIVCWYEHISELEARTGLCKYSLTPDLETLASIREFPIVRQKLTSLRCVNDKKLLGLGESTVHIWCYESGSLLRTIDLKITLGLVIGSFLHEEEMISTLFLMQLQKLPTSSENNRKRIKMIAINLHTATWYVGHSFDIALTSTRVTGESQVQSSAAVDDRQTSQRYCVTFQSGELLLINLSDPTVCWTNHKKLEKDILHAEENSFHVCSRLRSKTGEVYRPKERLLNVYNWHDGRDLLLYSDQCLSIKSIDEYMLECK